MMSFLRKRWRCLLLLLLTLIDLVVADPLPFVDEALLAGLTAGCFRKHRVSEPE